MNITDEMIAASNSIIEIFGEMELNRSLAENLDGPTAALMDPVSVHFWGLIAKEFEEKVGPFEVFRKEMGTSGEHEWSVASAGGFSCKAYALGRPVDEMFRGMAAKYWADRVHLHLNPRPKPVSGSVEKAPVWPAWSDINEVVKNLRGTWNDCLQLLPHDEIRARATAARDAAHTVIEAEVKKPRERGSYCKMRTLGLSSSPDLIAMGIKDFIVRLISSRSMIIASYEGVVEEDGARSVTGHDDSDYYDADVSFAFIAMTIERTLDDRALATIEKRFSDEHPGLLQAVIALKASAVERMPGVRDYDAMFRAAVDVLIELAPAVLASDPMKNTERGEKPVAWMCVNDGIESQEIIIDSEEARSRIMDPRTWTVTPLYPGGYLGEEIY